MSSLPWECFITAHRSSSCLSVGFPLAGVEGPALSLEDILDDELRSMYFKPKRSLTVS